MNGKEKEQLLYIERIIERKEIPHIRTALKIMREIKAKNWSVEDIEKLIEMYAHETLKPNKLVKAKCPECGKDFYLVVVKERVGTPSNRNNYRSKWICGDCLYEQYNKEDINQMVKQKNMDYYSVVLSWRELKLKLRKFDLINVV